MIVLNQTISCSFGDISIDRLHGCLQVFIAIKVFSGPFPCPMKRPIANSRNYEIFVQNCRISFKIDRPLLPVKFQSYH